jgi:hypothetical protein
MEPITLRLPADTLESLEEEATEHGVTRSEYIRTTLADRDDVERLRQRVTELEEEQATTEEENTASAARLRHSKRKTRRWLPRSTH